VGHHEKIPRKIFESRMSEYLSVKKKIALGYFFLALDILGYFWEDSAPEVFGPADRVG